MPITPSALAPNFCLNSGKAVPTPVKKTFGAEAGDLGLIGQADRVRRIAERDEDVRVAGLCVLDDRLQVLRAERIGLVIDELEAGLLESLARGGRLLDAELVADGGHRDLVADLAVLAQRVERGDETVDDLRRQAEPEGQVRPALHQLGRAVGVRRHGEMRVAVFVEDRRGGEVHPRAPRRQDEVDLVLRGETLDRLDQFLGVRAVVVLDHLDLHLLAADVEPAGVVHVLHPHLVVRQRGDGGARRSGARLRQRPADLDGVLRLRRRDEQRGECGRSQ